MRILARIASETGHTSNQKSIVYSNAPEERWGEMPEFFKKVRISLIKGVRPIWGTDEAIQAREELAKKARALIQECYQKCAREGGKPITECYRECAKQANLSKEYFNLWHGGS